MLDGSGGFSLNYNNLKELCAYLRAKLPMLLTDSILGAFKPEETKSLAEFHLMRARAHPLAVDWYYLAQGVIEGETNRKLCISERSLFLLDELIRLCGLLDVSGISRLLSRMGQSDQYHSAMFEALILSQYRQQGAKIEVVDEEPVQGKRRPDLKVSVDGADVYIECKSLEDLSRKESRIWEQLEGRIVKLLLTERDLLP